MRLLLIPIKVDVSFLSTKIKPSFLFLLIRIVSAFDKFSKTDRYTFNRVFVYMKTYINRNFVTGGKRTKNTAPVTERNIGRLPTFGTIFFVGTYLLTSL